MGSKAYSGMVTWNTPKSKTKPSWEIAIASRGSPHVSASHERPRTRHHLPFLQFVSERFFECRHKLTCREAQGVHIHERLEDLDNQGRTLV